MVEQKLIPQNGYYLNEREKLMKWIKEEIDILIKSYKQITMINLQILLPNRTSEAIRRKSSYLNLSSPQKKGTPEERFWEKIDKKSDNGCWNWTGTCNTNHYGEFSIRGKRVRIHRFSWEIHFGKIPNGLFVCHTCDNPKCANPEHLFLGTYQDNSDDKVKKNRQIVGENHCLHKLIESQVKEIRRLCCEGKLSQRKIAKVFNVSHSLIGYIHKNKRWKHVN